jgi:hypothetical protein
MSLPIMKKVHSILERKRRDLVHMGTSTLFIFRILKISKFYISMYSKIMALKYIGRFLQEECMQKSPVKKYIVFWRI